jgi:hypothetical protein
MGKLVGKIATIAVDYLFEDRLYLGDTVEILEQKEEKFFFGKRTVIKVKSLRFPKIEKEIFRSEIIFIRPKD